MANQKAQRAEIQLPLLLNLQEDRPKVASDFRSAEHMNAPFLNGMHSPLWKNTYEFTSKPVYDYKNNRYEIIDGYLTKNGEELFRVANKHFKREDVTEEFSKYLGFDYDNNGLIAKLEWETETNTAKFTYGNSILSKQLFINGVILTSRVRVVNNAAIAVIVFEENGQTKICYMNTETNVNEIRNIVWCTTQPKTTANADFVVSAITIPSPAPVINICYAGVTDTYAVSLVSNQGEVLFTKTEGYYTLVDSNGTITDGTSWIAAKGSATETIQNYEITNFLFGAQYSSVAANFNVYTRDDKWYYVNDPTTEVPNSDDIAFSPEIIPGQVFTYEDVGYNVYKATSYTNRVVFRAGVDSLYGKTTQMRVLFVDSYTSDYETFSGDNSSITIDHSETSWQSRNLRPVDGEILFGSDSYAIDPTKPQYTITLETTPTTQNAPYITFPNVFLDNGKLYSWYTLPEANTSSSGFALTLLQNSLIVESGTFTGFDANNKFTFDVLESHLVNTYTKYARENSIAVAQNFWNSSFKMCSDGVRTPYQIYVSKTAAETWSTTKKYTEYSNSNCTDMLYYTGTVPKNDQKFYRYATNNSQDVAWYNPGGFRVSYDKWNLLYSVGSDGSVAIQGISYSEEEDFMGTLVTPLASLADDSYIVVTNDFVIYKDAHNRYYKVSIEDGAILSSVFDNQYIIVNTTSYWNMWDETYNRKFHYATDYNNRAKVGLTRTEYRDTISTYYSTPDRRYFATAINYQFNTAPRLPVTSMFMPANAMNLIIADDNPSTRIHSYGAKSLEAREVQPIEVYLQGLTSSSIEYISSIKSYPNGEQIYKDGNMVGKSYSSSSSLIVVTDIFTTFINGAGNNDFAVEGIAKYPLQYNNQNRPMFLYSIVSGIDVDNVKWFFVIQGQYYAVIGEKLYAMIYSDGMISQSDAIIDIRDMYYVGNTPAIAFFVNPYTKQVYSFTGDANLQHIFDASKFNFELKDDKVSFWYDESTQSIYIKTDKGLLVFGTQNTYCLEEFLDTIEIEFVDGDIHIIGENKVDTLRYYHDREDYEDLPIAMETSFYGLGSDELATIDKWQITLYDPEHREQDVELQVRSLTDVTTVAETKKLHISKTDWDKWSHSVLVNFNPKLIRGQGIRLSVKSHSAIQKIVPHIMDLKAPQNSNAKFSV